jgi:Tol biopolymer transport system component
VEARPYTYLRLSPDGSRVALDIRDRQNDIWVWDFSRRNLTQVTFDPRFDRAPAWASDELLVYSGQERGVPGYLFQKRADGTGSAEPLTSGPNVQFANSVTPNGKRVVFWNTWRGLATVSLDNDHRAEPLLTLPPPLEPRNGEVSPDGQWLLYESNESGPGQNIFVRRMADVYGWKLQISTGPVCSRCGPETAERSSISRRTAP